MDVGIGVAGGTQDALEIDSDHSTPGDPAGLAELGAMLAELKKLDLEGIAATSGFNARWPEEEPR